MDERQALTIRLNASAAEVFLQQKKDMEARFGLKLTVSQVIILLINEMKAKQK